MKKEKWEKGGLEKGTRLFAEDRRRGKERNGGRRNGAVKFR